MTFQPDVTSGSGPQSRQDASYSPEERLPEELDDVDSLPLGDSLYLEGGLIEVLWQYATYQGQEILPGTDQTLLTKAQADDLYRLESGERATIILDASSGNVDEQLPVADKGAEVTVVRIDGSSNTATISTRPGSKIAWWGRGTENSFDLVEEQNIHLTSDGTDWYVENPAVYEVGSFVGGGIVPEQICLRHRVHHDLRIKTIAVDAESTPNNNFVFNLYIRDASQNETNPQSIKLTGGSHRASKDISVDVPKDEVVKVKAENKDDTNIADVSFSFDLIRI